MSKPPVYWSYAEQRYWINTPDGVEWFGGPLEAENAAAAVDRRQSALAERAAVAAWLRSDPESDWAKRDWYLAKQIEAGEHLK